MALQLTDNQLQAIQVTERITSIFSLLGIFFVLFTFSFSRHFNKPINRLIFYASWGNLGVNIASLISESGPAAGQRSSLCQSQAFLIQMFLGVDAFWNLCIACNVYLAFFRSYTAKQLKSLDPKYLLLCYGAAFIVAFVFIFVETKNRGKIYGPATIWCWIDVQWDFLRIVMLYGWAWLAMFLSLIVYCMAGHVIWKNRKHLQGFLNPLNEHPFTPSVTTEIQITSEARDTDATPDEELGVNADGFSPYSVSIGVDEQDRKPETRPPFLMSSLARTTSAEIVNAGAWLYARVAFLLFIALLVTWIPSSINRLYTLVHPDVIHFPLNYFSALVLPLQGFWNVLVYIATSQTACKRLWGDIRHRQLAPSQSGETGITFSQGVVGRVRTRRKESESLESDATSVTALASR